MTEANVTAAIGLGANLGDARQTVHDALVWLGQTPFVEVLRTSPVIRTKAWGKTDQPDFYNAAALVRTGWSARELLVWLQHLENEAGRVRRDKWGPRTLDLDLLFWGEEIIEEPGLQIPHPGIPVRPFVLEPLVQVAPEWRHPETGLTPQQMLDHLAAEARSEVCR